MMSILSRVNDSKDGQIQSKLERSVCLVASPPPSCVYPADAMAQ